MGGYFFLNDAYGSHEDDANADRWTQVSGHSREKDHTAHTGEDSTSLLDIEAMVGREDQRNRSKLEIENCPAERNPQREEKNHGLGNEHI